MGRGKSRWGKDIYFGVRDLVLLAENGEKMISMMERLEGYLERTRLELNGEKTKIMRFNRGGGRMEKREWR